MGSLMDASVLRWQPLLEQYAGDLPSGSVDALLAWIAEESDGRPESTGASYEVGIFQLDLQDGPAWGASIAQLHQTYDQLDDAGKALQVTSGLAYVNHARSVALSQLNAYTLSWSDADVWKLTKLQHGLPGIPVWFLPAAANANAANDWDSFRSFMDGLSQSDAYSIAPTSRTTTANYYARFGAILDNAERVGDAVGGSITGSATLDLLLVLAAAALAAVALRFL